MKVSVVIPVYNEHGTIEQVVKAVRASDITGFEIIVVDDASTDGTQEILKEQISALADKIIYQPHNMGKGAAVRVKLSCKAFWLEHAEKTVRCGNALRNFGPIM